MTDRAPLTTVTIKITDNPLAGMPGQVGYTIVVSAEPDIEFDENGGLPDPDTLPISVLAAVKCLSVLADVTMEVAFFQVARGSSN